jgi:hypothetical protein
MLEGSNTRRLGRTVRSTFDRLTSATRPAQTPARRLTPVSFATPAHTRCAFIGRLSKKATLVTRAPLRSGVRITLQCHTFKYSKGLLPFLSVDRASTFKSESTTALTTLSILIFQRLIIEVKRVRYGFRSCGSKFSGHFLEKERGASRILFSKNLVDFQRWTIFREARRLFAVGRDKGFRLCPILKRFA